MRDAFVLGLLLLPVVPLGAQAPHVTAQGDPSVAPDSIYRLAVDAARFPEEDAVYLLDDGIVRLEADARGTRTYRKIIQVLKPAAVRGLQEQSFAYSPSHQKFTLNWIRVVRPDGSVVSAEPSHVQDADVPARTDDPVYSDRRVKRVSLTGVAPGTLVDVSYTLEELKPFLPGDFFEAWSVNTVAQVARSRYVVDLPASVTPRLRERNLSFARTDRVLGDRHVYTWATSNLPRVRMQPLAADSNDVLMSVMVSSPTTWGDIAHWYAELAKPNAMGSPRLSAIVDSLVRDARTREDSMRAVHRWVAQDIRYVAIALGVSGYQPRSPEQVIRTGFGDCKDKATLFVTALAHLGITAYPVLLNSRGGVRRDMPSIYQFDHEIAAVRADAGYEFTDLTAELVPYGELPLPEHGGFGLVVRPDGGSSEVTFPTPALERNQSADLVAVTLDTLGFVDGRYSEWATGTQQYLLRGIFMHPRDSAQTARFANAVAGRMFEGAEGDSLVGFDGKDLRATPRMTMRIHHGRAATVAGSSLILNMPLQSMGSLTAMARDVMSEPRRFPIDAGKFWGNRTTAREFRIVLPPGWRADPPKGVRATSAFGSYLSEYTMEGDTLHLLRRMTGSTARVPKEQVGDFAAWLRAIAADDARVIVLTRNAVP